MKDNIYIQKFLELWSNPRYRSLIILGIYAIFFTFVILYVRALNNYTPTTNYQTPLEKFRLMNNYKYKASIKNEEMKELVGDVYNNHQLIQLEKNYYYYNGSKLYKKNEIYEENTQKLLEFDIWKFTPSFIFQLIEKGTFEAKTEYKDGISSETYLVSLDDFIKLYYLDESSGEGNISIITYTKENSVFKVELDLTTIYHMQQYSNAFDYKITLEYSLIDQISPIIVELESSD